MLKRYSKPSGNVPPTQGDVPESIGHIERETNCSPVQGDVPSALFGLVMFGPCSLYAEGDVPSQIGVTVATGICPPPPFYAGRCSVTGEWEIFETTCSHVFVLECSLGNASENAQHQIVPPTQGDVPRPP